MYQDVKQVIGKIPTKAKINGALQQMSIHLRVAAQIAETVRFKCGVGDTTAVSQLPVPLQTGATEPILRKRKCADETTAEGEPAPNTAQMVLTVKTVNSCLGNVIVAKFLIPLTI